MKSLILNYAKEHPTETTAYVGIALLMTGTWLNTDLASTLCAGGGLILVVALIKTLGHGI